MARLFTPSESKYYLMALDAGTGSIRAVIFDLEGNQIAVGQAEWRHLAVPDVPGSMEFDLNKNWQLACECMRQALHNAGIAPEYIAAVSACSMREGIVLYNNEGTPIWACANVDARAAREVSELKELHNNTFENEVYRATGQTLALSAIPRLLWLAHHRSDIYRQASTITMISDWLAYMLSGELAVDPSNAGTTGLLDLTTRDWKPALLDMAGLRADILSPVKETGTLLGVVSSQAAELCGLKAGTPVVVGGGDVQLGCLGLGVVRPAQTAVLGGTFWQQVVNLAAPVTDPEMNVRVNPHVIPGMVQAESISFFTGLTMRWFRDAFCAEEKLIAERLGIDTYTDSLHSQGSASSMWMRHVGGHERSRAGDGQLNTQANRYVLQLGGDLAQWSSNAQDRWHLGVMAGYANQHSNTQSNRVGYKSDGRISGYSAGLYATWYQNDANKTGAYVDSWALYNWFDNSVSSDNRSADDYDSRGVTASVEGGYTFEAGTFSGSEGTLNTWYVQPQAQITWMGVKDSDHTRKDGTRIETEGDGNVQTRLGVKTYLNSHHQRDDGKQREFQPYIEANWINNSKVYAVKMNGQTVGREGARNLGEVRTGVEAKVNNNLSLWGNVGVQLGDKGYSDTQGMLGVKYSW